MQRKRDKETKSCDRLEEMRTLNRNRQLRYREKQKREGEGSNAEPKPQKRKTRAEHEKQRDGWRVCKRKQRTAMSAQRKRRVREKDRERYAKKHQRQETANARDSSANTTVSVISPNAVKQKAHRVKKHLPASPNKFAQVVKHVVCNATPRKKACLRRVGIDHSRSNAMQVSDAFVGAVRQSFEELRHKRQRQWQVARRCLALSLKSTRRAIGLKATAKSANIGYNFLRKYTRRNFDNVGNVLRKPRSDKTSPEVVTAVEEFYDASASHVPDMKAVSKKTLLSAKVLSQPISELYTKFKETHPTMQMSCSQFHKLRPKHVKTTHSMKLYQSRCEHCTNPRLKLDALNKACDLTKKLESKIKSKADLSNVTLCPKPSPDSEFHAMKCLQRECIDCGVEAIEQHTAPMVAVAGNDDLKWQFWTTQDYVKRDQKTSKQKVLGTKKGAASELIKELQDDAQELPQHLLVAQWQKNAFDTLSKSVPRNSIVVHMDFSENYSTFYQEEISSAHWMKNLITIHPLVAFYRCPACDDDTRLVMDVLIFISDDNQHDHHAVQAFYALAIKFLKETRGISFDRVFEFTDGCASQYKSRGPMVDLSFGFKDFGIVRERICFGSCHGKGPCDAAGGVVKTACRMAVVRGKAVINNAASMYEHATSHLTRDGTIDDVCNHSRRKFFLVESIERDRPERVIKTSVKGTRKMHAIRMISPGVIDTRNLFCTCESCLSGSGGSCSNPDHVQPWIRQQLRLVVPYFTPRPEITDETSPQVTDETSPQVTDETSPQVTDETSPQVTDETSPQVTDETRPQVTDETSPQVTDETSPQVTDETSPQVTDETSPQVTDETSPQVTDETSPQVTDEKSPQVTDETSPQVTDETSPQVTDEQQPTDLTHGIRYIL